MQRGFSEQEIAARGYRSLGIQGRSALAKASHNGNPNDLAGVPGYYVASGNYGPYWTVAGSPGLLIPCHSPCGRIRAWRIRPDDPAGGGKYRWFSSGDRQNGTGSGVHCHVAKPISRPTTEGVVGITEGEHKANYASERLGYPFISIPGVSSWARALPDIAVLLPNGGNVIVALDMDWEEKPEVHRALWSICQATQALGYTVEVAQWNKDQKGLDDLLKTGTMPEVFPPTIIPAPKWSLRLSSCVLAEAPTMTELAVTKLKTVREMMRKRLASVLLPRSQCG